MPDRADEIIDRRRLRRKLTFWRAAALVIAVLALAGGGVRLMGGKLGVGASHIAKVRIEGTILEDEDLLQRLRDIRKSAAVRGVIVSIDSPGGTTAGGEALYDELRRLAAEKPVVAQVGTLAASAGYMVASATDHIVARQSSIVGSIGVLLQMPNVTGLMDKLGIKLEEVKSSPLKAEPSPFNPTTEEERAMIRNMILDSYDWFVGIVVDRRPLSREEAMALADGSVFTGRQALARKLVDALGGEEQALNWLESRGIDPSLQVVEWKRYDSEGWFSLGSFARQLGLTADWQKVASEIGAGRLFLDGLVSVWHPDATLQANKSQ